jgi:hypothetical protein
MHQERMGWEIEQRAEREQSESSSATFESGALGRYSTFIRIA